MCYLHIHNRFKCTHDDKVLEVVMELFIAQCEAANQQPVTAKEPIIQFHKKVESPVRKQKTSNMNGTNDWKVSVDLKTSLQFPVHIIQTEKRPDIEAWSDSKESVFLIELSVPTEYRGLLLFYDLQVKTFKSSYYSSYFRVEMVEKKPYISPSAFDQITGHPRGLC